MTSVITRPESPAFLFSPGESRGRRGSLNVQQAGPVSITNGVYGDAWLFGDGAGTTFQVEISEIGSIKNGTVIYRYSGSMASILASGSTATAMVGPSSGTSISFYTLAAGGETILADGEPGHSWIAFSWESGSSSNLYTPIDSAHSSQTADLDPNDEGKISFFGGVADQPILESALFYPFVLTPEEILGIAGIDGPWTWENSRLTSRMVEVQAAVPRMTSGLSIIETKVYASDMFGTVGSEIPITNARMTSDIDRAASKNRIELETVYLGPENQYTIGPGRWVTVFQEISRENEGTERVRRGTFELGHPTVSSMGSRDHVVNSGNDIVDRLARAAVLDTLYTPPRGYVMNDVQYAIRMLGITSMGPNQIENGGFEDGLSGWAGYGSPLSTNAQPGVGDSTPEGRSVCRASIPAGTEHPTYGGIRRVITSELDPSIRKAMISVWVYLFSSSSVNSEVLLECSFTTPSGTQYRNAGGWRRVKNGWTRLYAVIDIPEGWTAAHVYGVIRPREEVGQVSETQAAEWDDFQIRPITGDLLPESVLALPVNTTNAANRIQHLPGDTLLSAVNDRLAALGMMAVNATPDSKFTTRKSRDTATDAVVRTFHLNDDIRMIGDVTVERSVTSMYNRVFAIKEDFTTGESMIAIAENTNPNDPWSVHNILLEPKIVTSQDATDLQVLQDLADAELARASVQTSIKFGILPDPALTVYDMIYIDGPPGHRAIGRWAIESIESGLTTENPLMIIGARRSVR